jgi:hypothetical protein
MKGIKSLKVDGKHIDGDIIPIMPVGSTCNVEVEM